jgi:hypothetical protein
MNWDALSAVDTLIGGVAIIISLIYLGVQTKQNTKAMRSASVIRFAYLYLIFHLHSHKIQTSSLLSLAFTQNRQRSVAKRLCAMKWCC